MKNLFSVFIILTVLGSCKKKDDKSDFDRGAMLSSLSTNLILPSISDLETNLNQLNLSSNSFVENVNQENLDLIKLDFLETYKAYQRCKMFDFGPMSDYGISSAMNTYPTDTTKISANIEAGSYSLTSVENITAIGLPAIDFLLFKDTDTQILNNFSGNSNAENRKTYLTDLTTKMKNEFSMVADKWQSYQMTFNSADGNDIGGSTSILFNAFIKDIELLKNAKIGIPGGFQTSGQTLPNYCEGFYSGVSTDLAIENTQALQDLFNGLNAISFDDYIKDVESDDIDTSLSDNINSQFQKILSKLQKIGNPLSQKVDSNSTDVVDAHNEIKKLVTFVKTDMSSILGLLITFQDNDGD